MANVHTFRNHGTNVISRTSAKVSLRIQADGTLDIEFGRIALRLTPKQAADLQRLMRAVPAPAEKA